MPPSRAWKPDVLSPSYSRWAGSLGRLFRSPTAARPAPGAPTKSWIASRSLTTAVTGEDDLRRQRQDGVEDLKQRLRSLLAAADSGEAGAVDGADASKTKKQAKTFVRPEYADVRKQDIYEAPSLPCVFLHGLFGFSTLTPVSSLPQFNIDYWRGIVQRLEAAGVEVLVTNVKTSASIEERARDAARMIEAKFPGRDVNLLGHSMGGLDARYLTSCLQKENTFRVRSVTTIATPHKGSPFASYLLYDVIGRERLPSLLNLVQRVGIPGGGEAFDCLTTESMRAFNERVLDVPGVRYTSWGAAFKPGLFNEFRFPHGIIWEKEGHNDGLVSIESAKWGEYKGTFKGTHIDLIGWGNAIQTQWASLTGSEYPFDSQSFYLMVCEDLARDGL
ncbi:unnamed protein product [Parajaminaea phylloscopi]